MIRRFLPFALVLLAAGCARSEEANLIAIEDDSNLPVAAVHQPEGEDDELALGEWRPGLQDEQPIVEFGPRGAPALFSLRCDARHGTLLQRHDVALAGDLPEMLITVGSETKRLAVVSVPGPMPVMRATLPPNDTFRGVLARATTPIIIRIGDSAPLVLPPSPLVGSYANGCASGENLSPAIDAPAANQAEAAGNNAE